MQVDIHAFETAKEADWFLEGFNIAAGKGRHAIRGECECNILVVDEASDGEGKYIKHENNRSE